MMKKAATKYRIRRCAMCPGDTEYFCKSCSRNMCYKCKENHVHDLKTKDHNVKMNYEKYNIIPREEICVRHPNNVYRMYCETCALPLCYNCTGHETHKQLDMGKAHKIKKHKIRYTIHTLRSEALFYKTALLRRTIIDITTCRRDFSLYQLQMLTKAYRLTTLTDHVLSDFDFNHSCLQQKISIIQYLPSVLFYENKYETSAFKPVAFLLFIKKTRHPKIEDSPHFTYHQNVSMNRSLNKEDVIESVSGIEIKEIGKRQIGIEHLLKLMSKPELYKTFRVTSVRRCYHISFVTSDMVWVSEGNNLILTNTTGDTLHHLKNLHSSHGTHTINNERELIYIDINNNIQILSKDLCTATTFIEKSESTWKLQCVYWSPSTGDLLVGIDRKDTKTGKITRYNKAGLQTQTIENDDTGRKLFKQPIAVTENNNGDIVVADWSAIVVTDHSGRYRFTYTGQRSTSRLRPRGICTNVLSHILACDIKTLTVQVINKDGQFLLYLLQKPSRICIPLSLSYDVNTHRLWVGSRVNNKVCVYQFLARQDVLTD